MSSTAKMESSLAARSDETKQGKRKTNFSEQELNTLITLIEYDKSILFSTINNEAKNKEKNIIWERITRAVNAVGNNYRTSEDVRKKWANYKSQVKAKAARSGRQHHRTGEASPTDELYSPIEQKALDAIREGSVRRIGGGIDFRIEDQPGKRVTTATVSREGPWPVELIASSSSSNTRVPSEGSLGSKTTRLLSSVPSLAYSLDKSENLKRKRDESSDHEEETLGKLLKVEEERLEIEKQRMNIEWRRLEIEEKRLELELKRCGQSPDEK